MPTPNPSSQESTPRLISTLALALSAITAISTLPWAWMAIGKFGGFAWGLFGFEIIVLIGCVMTMLVCLGKVRVAGAFPMAIACLVGTILVGMVFGIHVDARAVVGDNPTISPWINRTLMLRLTMMMLFASLAMLDVYRRDARSWGLLLRSALFLAPVLVAVALLKVKGVPSFSDSSGELDPARMIVILLGGLFLGILLSVGGHFLIRSFQIALPESNPNSTPDKTDKKPA